MTWLLFVLSVKPYLLEKMASLSPKRAERAIFHPEFKGHFQTDSLIKCYFSSVQYLLILLRGHM